MDLARKKEFIAVILNLKDKIFIVYVNSSVNIHLNIHLFHRVLLIFFLNNKISIVILSKHADFINVFSLESINKLSKHNRINNYLINLIDD